MLTADSFKNQDRQLNFWGAGTEIHAAVLTYHSLENTI